MPGLKIKVGSQTYEINKMTIGEQRRAKRLFGVADMSDIALGDIDAIAALVFTAIRRTDKDTPEHVLLERIDSLDEIEVSDADDPEDTPGPGADPTPAPADEVGEDSKPKASRKPKKASASSE